MPHSKVAAHITNGQVVKGHTSGSLPGRTALCCVLQVNNERISAVTASAKAAEFLKWNADTPVLGS